jgi:hypothetical protein
MGRTALYDRKALAGLLEVQHGVVTRSQARSCAMSQAALWHRIRPEGRWRVLLPGVYLSYTGVATVNQRKMAALLYAGRGSVITGPAALIAHGMRAPQAALAAGVVDVLVPAERRRRDYGFVRVRRTSRMPAIVFRVGCLQYVPPARAVADTALGLREVGEVRAVVAGAVQSGKTGIADLADELAKGPVAHSALFRLVLAEVADGVRSVAEAELRALIKKWRVPDPLYNPRLYLGEAFLASPDAWWPDAGVAVEVDSREWHLSPRTWERTMARHSKMSALGITVLHYPPRRLRSEPGVVAAEIKSALAAAQGRQLPAIRSMAA